MIRKWWRRLELSLGLGVAGVCVVSAARAEPVPPEQQAAERAARAEELSGEAAERLPAPELMLEVWRVPISRPYALDDADMIRLGVEQELPAPGERAARRRAAELRAAARR